MKCRAVMGLLAKRGEVAELPAEAQQHIRECGSCAAQAHLLRKAEETLRCVREAEEPAWFDEAFFAKLEREKARSASRLPNRLREALPPSRRWKLGLVLAIVLAHILALSPVARSLVSAPSNGAKYTAEMAPRIRQGVAEWARHVTFTIFGGSQPEQAPGKHKSSAAPDRRNHALPVA